MKTNRKKYVIIGSLAFLIIFLGVLLGTRPKADIPTEPEILPVEDAISIPEVKPEVHIDNSTNSKPSLNTEKPLSDGESSISNESASSQAIQPVVPKPKEPTEQEKTNPTETPSGTSTVETEDGGVKPAPEASEPTGGETKGGQIYVPGFGWVDGTGSGSSGKTTDGDGDINKQVGNMG